MKPKTTIIDFMIEHPVITFFMVLALCEVVVNIVGVYSGNCVDWSLFSFEWSS